MGYRKQLQSSIPARERVIKYQEYWDFVAWSATPSPLRTPKTQREFAKEHSVHEVTLSVWKRIEGFNEDRWKVICDKVGEDLPDILFALKNRVFKDGNPRAAELLVNWARDVIPTIKVIQEGGKIDVNDPKTKEILEKVNELTKKLL